MTNKEKLNAILQLRLFFSTERELSQYIDYKLKNNHFNRFKEFQADAYYSKFARLCRDYTTGRMELDAVLEAYEATSKFYKRYIEDTAHEKRKTFMPLLLARVFLGGGVKGVKEVKGVKGVGGDVIGAKDALLCERYMAENEKAKKLNIGILLLLTYRLLPTFKNKAAQDVKDIIGDFQRAYDILMDTAQSRKHTASTVYNEMLCLKEIRCLIEEEKAGDEYLNRLVLIDLTNTALSRIFALENPVKQMEYSNELPPMDFQLPRFWRQEGDAENVVWEFVEQNLNAYFLFRNEIDYQNKRIHFTKYQLFFRDYGDTDSCYTIIMRPAFLYHNILRREQPDDAITFDYTDFEYDEGGKTLKQLTFTMDSPLGTTPLTLKPVKLPAIRYYQQYIDHTGVGEGFTDQDQCLQYSVYTEAIDVAVSARAILFSFGDSVYRLDKYDEEGNETVHGISALVHSDNYIFAKLIDEGNERCFLSLDSINQNLDLEELQKQPYFREITHTNEVF